MKKQQMIGIAMMIIGVLAAIFFGSAWLQGPGQLATSLSMGLPPALPAAAGVAIFAAGIGLARSRHA